MKFVEEYRDKDKVQLIVNRIREISKKEISLMEVCGGHTMAIHKFGIPALLPGNIKLHSGPGCPVCVTSTNFIDTAIEYSKNRNFIIATYGDLIRIPGSDSTLDIEKAKGANVKVVYSVLEALEIARQNRNKAVIFLGIGFETTAPISAAAIKKASNEKIDNFFLYSSHKIMPPAMAAIINEGVKINGYICPGHVSAITGSEIYNPLCDQYKVGCVISGFEPMDILQSIYMLVDQFEKDDPKVEIQYKRAVKPEGNLKAKSIMNEVFEFGNDWWRGFGEIPRSGLKLREKFFSFDARHKFPVNVQEVKEIKGCICGEILKGLKTPADCKLFRVACNPSNPLGACMVSNEGACQAFFRYGVRKNAKFEK